MIALDTNVVAELLLDEPSRNVVTWFRKQPEALVVTSITIAEIAYGIERLPDGRRKEALDRAFKTFLSEDLAPDAILPFCDEAARIYGTLVADLQRRGKEVGRFDAMIASIALHHNCGVATRNIRHFERTGLRILDPWT